MLHAVRVLFAFSTSMLPLLSSAFATRSAGSVSAALLSEAYVVEIGDVTWTADAPDGWLNESVVEGGGAWV